MWNMTGFTVQMKVIFCGADGDGMSEADRRGCSNNHTANGYDQLDMAD